MAAVIRTFADALVANGPAPEYAKALMLYGQFVGDWETETRAFLPTGEVEESRWDVRFDWVLEGRAVQDAWISPPRNGAAMGWHEPGNRFSTTLRLYDPRTDAWTILWANPPSGVVITQIGRQCGDEIVQESPRGPDGALSRWVYRDITPVSFRWCSEVSTDNGDTWTLIQEMRARRASRT